jgi:hypothetical protein
VNVQLLSFWMGPPLGAVERACLRSMVGQGHPVAIYCYEPPGRVPDGVDLRDAAEIFPRSEVIHHRSGSVALFSNRFRYELQRRALGTWVDTDLYVLKPIDGTRPYLFGEEKPGFFNIGVLRLPPDSPMVAPLLDIFREKAVPPWLEARHRLAAYWRLWRTGRTGLSRMPWGSAGPAALTAIARMTGMSGHAQPAEVFSPVHWRDAAWLRDPAQRLEDRIGPRTVAIHLWNQIIKDFKDEPAAPGSFLARLQEEGA